MYFQKFIEILTGYIKIICEKLTKFHKHVKLKKEEEPMPTLGTALKVAKAAKEDADAYAKDTEPNKEEETNNEPEQVAEDTADKGTEAPKVESDITDSTQSVEQPEATTPNPDEVQDTNDYKKMYNELKAQYEQAFKEGASGNFDTLGNETKQEREQAKEDRLTYGNLFADAEDTAIDEREREREEAKEMATSGNFQQLRRPIENTAKAVESIGEGIGKRSQGIKEQQEMTSGIKGKGINTFDDLFDTIGDSINIATTARNVTRR